MGISARIMHANLTHAKVLVVVCKHGHINLSQFIFQVTGMIIRYDS